MKNLILFVCVGLSLLFSSCAETSSIEETEEQTRSSNVQLNVSLPEWISDSRASNMLFPLNIFITEKDDDDIIKHISTSSESSFYINLPTGKSYDIFAVCGIPNSNLPEDVITTNITIPEENGMVKEFALGKTSLTIEANSVEQEAIEIKAIIQVISLDVKITGVPSSITNMKMHVEDLADVFSIDYGWHPTNNTNKSVTFALTKNETTNTLFEGSRIIQPENRNGAKFYVEVTTNDGSTNILSYTPSNQLSVGKHLAENFDFSDLSLVANNVSLEDWINENEEGTLQEYRGFEVGTQYFSYPATVYYASSSTLTLFAHKPMTVTVDEVKDFENIGELTYTLAPEVNVKRWAFPASNTAPKHFFTMIDKIGFEELNRQIASSGGTVISEDATNVLAYKDKNTSILYRFNFEDRNFVAVDDDDKGEYLLYPSGIIQFTY